MNISDRFLELQKKKFIILDQIKPVAKEQYIIMLKICTSCKCHFEKNELIMSYRLVESSPWNLKDIAVGSLCMS